MSRKLLLLMLLALLIGTLNLASRVEKAKASGTVYIRADGSVEPEGTPISTFDNVTYTLTGNIYDAIAVQRSNIMIDGAGYKLQATGPYTYIGIDLGDQTNVTVTHLEVVDFYYGIQVSGSNNKIADNTVTENAYGIVLLGGFKNNVTGNNVTANMEGIHVRPDALGVPICSNHRISGNTLKRNHWGIEIKYSCNNTISENTIALGATGLLVHYSSMYNSVIYNNITYNTDYGIYLFESSNNTIHHNNITQNTDGIYLRESSNNTVYHNNFIDNTQQVHQPWWDYPAIPASVNVWDDGYPSGGNYWSDYAARYPNATEIDGSGVWNTSYVIDANNTDHYPLMNVTPIPEFPSLVMPLFMIATLLTAIVYRRKGSTMRSKDFSDSEVFNQVQI